MKRENVLLALSIAMFAVCLAITAPGIFAWIDLIEYACK